MESLLIVFVILLFLAAGIYLPTRAILEELGAIEQAIKDLSAKLDKQNRKRQGPRTKKS